MTVNEALTRVMEDRPGEATEAELRKWLQDLDLRWKLEQIDTHWPTPEEAAAAAYAAAEEEAEEPAATISPIDTSGYAADTNPLALGWWEDDPEDVTGLYKAPTSDTTIQAGKNYYRKPPKEMVSQEYLAIWEAQEDEEEEEETEDEQVLLIPAPDDEVYIYWLYSKIDMRLGEIARYNNDAMLFNAAWDAAAKRWNRTHRYKGRQLRHVVYGSLPTPRPLEDPLNQRGDWYGWR